MTGMINAVYNKTEIILIVLDNATTAMTGQQPHPGTGRTMMGTAGERVEIEAILRAAGISFVAVADPFDLRNAVEIIRQAMDAPGVKAIIFRSPCIAVSKPTGQCHCKS